MSNELIAIIGLILTAGGLIYNGHQIRGSKKVARGEFLLHLDELFQQHNETHTKLRPGGMWGDGKTGPSSTEEWVAVERYMGLFERINILVEDKILNTETVERLYGYRITNITRNQVIQKTKLEQQSEGWKNFIKLNNKILDLLHKCDIIGR